MVDQLASVNTPARSLVPETFLRWVCGRSASKSPFPNQRPRFLSASKRHMGGPYLKVLTSTNLDSGYRLPHRSTSVEESCRLRGNNQAYSDLAGRASTVLPETRDDAQSASVSDGEAKYHHRCTSPQ